jgi:ATP synthase protein I
MNEAGKTATYVVLFSEVGAVLFVTVLVGVLAGYWLDQRLGTVPLFVLVGFGLGCVSGAVGCWRLLSRFLAQLDEDE